MFAGSAFRDVYGFRQAFGLDGARAQITRRAGGRFTAFDGALSGRNLLIVPNRLIVQAWRSTAFKRDDPDSILVLEFSKAPGGAKVHMVHVNVPPQDHQRRPQGLAEVLLETLESVSSWTKANASYT